MRETSRDYLGFWVLADITSIMVNQMEKEMEHDIESGYRDYMGMIELGGPGCLVCNAGQETGKNCSIVGFRVRCQGDLVRRLLTHWDDWGRPIAKRGYK